MFGLFTPESVLFIDQREATLTFLTARAKKAGQTVKVRFDLPGAPKPGRLDLSVRVQTSRPISTGQGHICVGTLLSATEALGSIEDNLRTFCKRPDMGFAGRRSERLPISLRVMGRELPGFGAVTVDISLHGVRLVCQGPIKQGLLANLVVESDIGSVGKLHLRARAIWSADNPSGRGVLAGFEFFDLVGPAHEELEKYHKSLTARLKGDVMHRQIMDGEFVARESDNKSPFASGTLPPPPPPPPPPPSPQG